MKNKNIQIITLGCKVNQYESEAIAADLQNNGFVLPKDNATAQNNGNSVSVCIINTCTVTKKASMQSRQAVRKAIRSFPNARIIVTGCYAQKEPDIVGGIEGVHAVFGHGEKYRIPSFLRDFEFADAGNVHRFWAPVDHLRRFPDLPETPIGSRSRPFLKIQDGCDAFCTYCIVPHVRGRSCSMPLETVLQHVRRIHTAGYHEIVFTGIHLGCYGKDLRPRRGLIDVLKSIRNKEKIHRVRLSSIEPRELTDDIIDYMATTASGAGRICPHVHVPLQSGDDGILQQMNRPYTASFFQERILRARAAMPDAAIGADVLVGFPGENKKTFDRTIALLSDLPVTYLHVFPYSPRSGTQAFSFPGRPSPDAVHRQCARLRELGHRKRLEFFRRFIGTEAEIVVEGNTNGKTAVLRGTTANYIPVVLTGIEAEPHSLVRGRILRVEDDGTVIAGPVS